MDRRRFLGSLGSAPFFGGCLHNPFSSGVPRSVSVQSVDREPREYGISLHVTIAEPEVTTSHTASVEVQFRNESEETTADIGLDTQYPDPLWSIDEKYTRKPGLILIPNGFSPMPDRASRYCWEPPDSYEFGGPGLAESTTLDPSEQLTRTYSVWGDNAVAGCMPSGEYRFGVRSNRSDRALEWMFTLSIME